MTTTPIKLGAGREADVYVRDDATVIKVWRMPTPGRARAEEARLRDVRAAGIRAPAPLGLIDVDGRPGLVLERLAGFDLHKQVVDRPWSLFGAATVLAAVQLAVHIVRAPPSLPPVREVVAARIRASAVDLADAALAALELLPAGTATLHGNLHLGNIVTTPAGNVAVDWADATIGDPHAEVALTLVRYSVASLGADDPTVLRLGQSAGRLLLRRAYRRAYTSLSPLDDRLLNQWVAVRAVERLAERNAGEERALRRLAASLA